MSSIVRIITKLKYQTPRPTHSVTRLWRVAPIATTTSTTYLYHRLFNQSTRNANQSPYVAQLSCGEMLRNCQMSRWCCGVAQVDQPRCQASVSLSGVTSNIRAFPASLSRDCGKCFATYDACFEEVVVVKPVEGCDALVQPANTSDALASVTTMVRRGTPRPNERNDFMALLLRVGSPHCAPDGSYSVGVAIERSVRLRYRSRRTPRGAE
jgi:hypothetical protein